MFPKKKKASIEYYILCKFGMQTYSHSVIFNGNYDYYFMTGSRDEGFESPTPNVIEFKKKRLILRFY